jgi:hypothetical protein
LRWNKGGKAGDSFTIKSFYNLYPVPNVIEMSTGNTSWGVKAGGAKGWQPYHFHVPIALKYGSLNLLEPSGPVQVCNGIALPFTKRYLHLRGNNPWYTFRRMSLKAGLDSTEKRKTLTRFSILSAFILFTKSNKPCHLLSVCPCIIFTCEEEKTN